MNNMDILEFIDLYIKAVEETKASVERILEEAPRPTERPD